MTVLLPTALDLHAAARHADGEGERSRIDALAHLAAMAVDDERLEAEFAPRPVQLVGADRLAHGRAGAVGVEAAQDQRAELHMAAVYVRLGFAGRNDGEPGQDLSRQTAQDEDPQRAGRDHPPEPVAGPARRLRRSAGRVEAA